MPHSFYSHKNKRYFHLGKVTIPLDVKIVTLLQSLTTTRYILEIFEFLRVKLGCFSNFPQGETVYSANKII